MLVHGRRRPTASSSVTYSIVDTTAPTITFDSRTPANANGWNNGDVTVTWTCSDSWRFGCDCDATVSETVSTEGENQSATGTCEDFAGNTASDTQTGINIDLTDPTVSFDHVDPAANGNGWNNTDVTVTWTCPDSAFGPGRCDRFRDRSRPRVEPIRHRNLRGPCWQHRERRLTTGINIDLKRTPTRRRSWAAPRPGAATTSARSQRRQRARPMTSLSGLAGCVVTGHSASCRIRTR